jgi:septum formation protein
MQTLILASSSPYRKELLSRLKLPFITLSPQVDETALPNEAPEDTALRLAEKKARSIAKDYPDALIIGCDQVASLHGQPIGKPGNHQNAVNQLKQMSGQTVIFYSAICLLNSKHQKVQKAVIPYEVKFRSLSDSLINRYLKAEKPYDCAGSAKSEGLGIILIEKMDGADPNALIGLPLIALVDMLHQEHIEILHGA